jgi:predicted GNAT superfamily acetyltransferase
VLGARSRTYEVDLYGSRTDALNAGLATDRLLVEWTTQDPDVLGGRTQRFPDATELIRVDATDGVRQSRGTQLPSGHHLHLAIPAKIVELKAAHPELARSWQLAVRESFLAAFAAGYELVGFARDGADPCYLLEKA